MARSLASPRAQRGAALLGLLAVAVMVFGYVLASRLNAASQFVAANRDDNARVLAQAKRALIGWMVVNAASNDGNPGRLPCPEALNAIGTDSEGIAAPLVSPSTPNCTTVGRLPWRTLGLDKLVDAASEPLWYVVSPNWALQNSSTLLTINSDSSGAMVIDGQAAPNEVVALIIAPGPVMNVQAAAGCTARAQVRATPAPSMDPADYLECFNAATPAFSTRGPTTSFNDQVLRVTARDLVPSLEAAIADRMQRQIAPSMRSAAYTSAVYSGLPGGSPAPRLFPYPRRFEDPTTSIYLGEPLSVTGSTKPQGLLPFNSIATGCTAPMPCRTLPVTRTPTVRSTASGYLMSYSCPMPPSSTEVLCEGQYHEDDTTPSATVRLEMTVTFEEYLLGFRAIAASPATYVVVEARDNGGSGAWTAVPATFTLVKINDGSASLPDGSSPAPNRGSMTLAFRADLPNIDANGWGSYADFRMRLNRAVVTDHALVNRNDATVGWFARNEWYRYTYYAVAQRDTGDFLPSLGCSAASGNCIRYIDSGTYNIRALLVLAGRALPTQTRATASDRADRTNYVENANADDGTNYEQRIPRMSNSAITSPFVAPWNDRVILVDWDAASPPNASQVLSLSPLRVVTLP